MVPATLIVVPCHDEARYLPDLIVALHTQLPAWPHWRAVLVDDASTDATPHLVDQAATHPQIVAHHVQLRSPGGARSAGVALATEPPHHAEPACAPACAPASSGQLPRWIITTDADVSLPGDWVARWAEALARAEPDEAVGALNGEEDQHHLLAPFPRASRLSAAFGTVAARAEALVGVTNLNGVNHAVRLEAYHCCGPYLQPTAPGPYGPQHLAGEDWDLGIRLRLAGYRIDPVAVAVADRGRRLLADLRAYLDGSAYEGPFRRVVGQQAPVDLGAEEVRALWSASQQRALRHFYAKPLLAQPALLEGPIGLRPETVARLRAWIERWPAPTFAESRNGFLYGRLGRFTDAFAEELLAELGLNEPAPEDL
ncbi:MAG: glycosyltransferase family 2 protein [Acidimicrobiales bacterium]